MLRKGAYILPLATLRNGKELLEEDFPLGIDLKRMGVKDYSP